MINLWDWAVAAYAAEGVPEACASLQDQDEQNVCLLLWAGWNAATGRRPDEDTIEAACDTARAWETTTIAPLRAVRRTLKLPVPDIDDAARKAVRNRIKAVELEAERNLLLALECLSPAPSDSPRPAIDALAETARVWTRIIPRPALIRLAERLPA
ncbi:MAG: TIGR02444 family protein [Brevundimonas sp.]